MKIAHKLWLAFGVLGLVFLVAGVAILSSGQAVRGALDEIVRVEEPMRAASFEMEINAVEISRDVLEYTQTGDPRYRERFADDRADFERSKASYDELVDTQTGREQGERIGSLYREYVAVGEDLMDERDARGEASDGTALPQLREFAGLEADLDDVLDEEVQPSAGRQLVEAEEAAGDAIRDLYLTVAVLLLAGFLVATIATYLIGRGVLRSVRRLKEGADRIGRGDLDHRIEVETRDELGIVSLAFNDMMDKRREADAALRESEARTRAVVETAPDAIITMTNGITRTFNTGAERIFGYTAEEAIGQPLRMLMPERFRGPHEAGFRRYLETGEGRIVGKGPVELSGLRKDGTEFPLELSLGKMHEEDDILFTGILRDVSERKQAEEALHQETSVVQLLQMVATTANEAPSAEEAMQACLELIWAHTGWPVAAVSRSGTSLASARSSNASRPSSASSTS